MKKFLLFLIICGGILYFITKCADTESGPEPNAEYNAKTYSPNDTIDAWDEETYNLYRWDGEDDGN